MDEGRAMLLGNLDRLHTTGMGIERIQRNLGLPGVDVVVWCKGMIADPLSQITRQGKNWYVTVDGVIITVNAHSYTIITAHIQNDL
jgi:hypothetical protein